MFEVTSSMRAVSRGRAGRVAMLSRGKSKSNCETSIANGQQI